jgi:hypothetical protein
MSNSPVVLLYTDTIPVKYVALLFEFEATILSPDKYAKSIFTVILNACFVVSTTNKVDFVLNLSPL